MKLSKNGKLIIVGIIVVALVGGGAWYYQDQQFKKQETENKKQAEELNKKLEDSKKELDKLKKESEEEDSEEEAGIIEGSLSYPSEFIPEDMKVCAVNIVSKKETCTTKHIKNSKYTNGTGYQIEVPAGTYNVYSSTAQMANYKAYYSEAVTCGLEAACTSHAPLSVKVTADKTTSKVDPADWYNE